MELQFRGAISTMHAAADAERTLWVKWGTAIRFDCYVPVDFGPNVPRDLQKYVPKFLFAIVPVFHFATLEERWQPFAAFAYSEGVGR